MSLTLEAFYRATYAPLFLIDARPATHRAYDEAVAHWTRLATAHQLTEIGVRTLADFRAKLCTQQGRRPGSTMAFNSVNKVMRHINALLAKAGPPGPGNRDALCIIPTCPWVRPLKTPRRDRLCHRLLDGINTLANRCERGVKFVVTTQMIELDGAVVRTRIISASIWLQEMARASTGISTDQQLAYGEITASNRSTRLFRAFAATRASRLACGRRLR